MSTAHQNQYTARTVCIPGEGRVKLRSSCDACSASRVKCDRRTPCERCRSHAITCTYSPSRRHGKQSWAQRVAEKHRRQLESTMHTHDPPPPAPIGTFYPMYPQPGAPNTITPPLTASPVVMTDPTMGFPSEHCAMKNLTARDSIFDDSFPPHFAGPGVSPSFSPALCATPSPTNTSTSTNVETGTSSLLQPGSQSPVRNCEALALATFDSLLPGTPSCSHTRTAEHPHPTSTPSLPQDIPPLHEILYLNRTAVCTVQELMGCPCALQPPLALLIMAIVSKTLSWYRLAVNLSFKNTTQAFGFGLQPSPTHTQAMQYAIPNSHSMPATAQCELPQNPGATKPNTVQIGAFNLEEPDEAILVRNVVMSEVKKVGHLVDVMNGTAGLKPGDEVDQNGQQAMSPWYKIGGESLKKDVQDTLQEIWGKISRQATFVSQLEEYGQKWPISA